MIGGYAEHFAKQALHFVNTVQAAVVAAVASCFGKAFLVGFNGGEKAFHSGNLLGRGLPARHIEL